MIGIIISLSVAAVFATIIAYHEGEVKYSKKYKKEALKLRKLLEDAKKDFYNKGHKDGFYKGQHQGFEDGQRYAEAVRHNEQELKKEGILP